MLVAAAIRDSLERQGQAMPGQTAVVAEELGALARASRTTASFDLVSAVAYDRLLAGDVGRSALEPTLPPAARRWRIARSGQGSGRACGPREARGRGAR